MPVNTLTVVVSVSYINQFTLSTGVNTGQLTFTDDPLSDKTTFSIAPMNESSSLNKIDNYGIWNSSYVYTLLYITS